MQVRNRRDEAEAEAGTRLRTARFEPHESLDGMAAVRFGDAGTMSATVSLT